MTPVTIKVAGKYALKSAFVEGEKFLVVVQAERFQENGCHDVGIGFVATSNFKNLIDSTGIVNRCTKCHWVSRRRTQIVIVEFLRRNILTKEPIIVYS